jgi:hypothetical protein
LTSSTTTEREAAPLFRGRVETDRRLLLPAMSANAGRDAAASAIAANQGRLLV